MQKKLCVGSGVVLYPFVVRCESRVKRVGEPRTIFCLETRLILNKLLSKFFLRALRQTQDRLYGSRLVTLAPHHERFSVIFEKMLAISFIGRWFLFQNSIRNN